MSEHICALFAKRIAVASGNRTDRFDRHILISILRRGDDTHENDDSMSRVEKRSYARSQALFIGSELEMCGPSRKHFHDPYVPASGLSVMSNAKLQMSYLA